MWRSRRVRSDARGCRQLSTFGHVRPVASCQPPFPNPNAPHSQTGRRSARFLRPAPAQSTWCSATPRPAWLRGEGGGGGRGSQQAGRLDERAPVQGGCASWSKQLRKPTASCLSLLPSPPRTVLVEGLGLGCEEVGPLLARGGVPGDDAALDGAQVHLGWWWARMGALRLQGRRCCCRRSWAWCFQALAWLGGGRCTTNGSCSPTMHPGTRVCWALAPPGSPSRATAGRGWQPPPPCGERAGWASRTDADESTAAYRRKPGTQLLALVPHAHPPAARLPAVQQLGGRGGANEHTAAHGWCRAPAQQGIDGGGTGGGSVWVNNRAAGACSCT